MSTPEQPTAAPIAAPRRAPVPRRVHSLTPDDWIALGGSIVASLALVAIVYLHLLDASGVLGFLICWYVAFLGIYGGVSAMSSGRPFVVERLVTATLYIVCGIVLFALATTIIYVFAEGWRALVHVSFFTHDMSGVAPNAPLAKGGILHAIVGTVIEIGIAIVIAVPLGIGTAVYMCEVGGRFANLVRTVVEAMTALPEILAGLFVYVVLIVDVGLPRSGLAVSCAMAVTMVPIIARAGEVALRVVPAGLREASHALGASHWKTVRKVVLPSARAGLATATILAIARGVGETAIPLLTSGASSFLTINPAQNPMNSLPLYILTSYLAHEPVATTRGFGAASVLLAMVLVLFVVVRLLSRDRAVK